MKIKYLFTLLFILSISHSTFAQQAPKLPKESLQTSNADTGIPKPLGTPTEIQQNLLNLLSAQTEVIKALSKRIDNMEVRVKKLEGEKK
ncbi:MAG: hypothetical protein V4525_07695 [Pseudomonadota bacterium]